MSESELAEFKNEQNSGNSKILLILIQTIKVWLNENTRCKN